MMFNKQQKLQTSPPVSKMPYTITCITFVIIVQSIRDVNNVFIIYFAYYMLKY